jgi:hypothetical protein
MVIAVRRRIAAGRAAVRRRLPEELVEQGVSVVM